MRRRRAVIGALDEIGPTLAGEAGTRMRRSFPRGDHHGAEAGYSGGVAVAAALLAVLAFERRDLTA